MRGSAVIANATGYTKPINAVIAVGTFNAQTATCCTTFVVCCGDEYFTVIPSGFYCLAGDTMQCTGEATNCNGTVVYPSASYTSSNTSVATVSSGGLMTGVAPGSVTITAHFSSVPVETGTFCAPYVCATAPTTGSTSANVVTATITVHFTGSKSAGDNLSFEKSTSECSESLGLLNCPTVGWWHWNVEVEDDVSDDASKWTPHQSYTGSVSGKYKDSNGNLQSFSSSLNVPNDDPGSAFVQQPAGQKTIFWIDGPGHGYLQNGYKVDSMTQIQNFTSKVCSNVTTTTCQSVAWYVKLVVDPGAVLDATNSSAGFGSK